MIVRAWASSDGVARMSQDARSPVFFMETDMPDAREWIARLRLQRHREGGWFRENYRCAESIAQDHLPERFAGYRCFSTAIYYLLESDDFSALHRIAQDEG